MDQTTNSPTRLGYMEGLDSDHNTSYDERKTLFWVGISSNIIIAAVAAIGNGLVLYASYGNQNTGRFRYLDDVIKSLAVSDMLCALIGSPFQFYIYYMGEF